MNEAIGDFFILIYSSSRDTQSSHKLSFKNKWHTTAYVGNFIVCAERKSNCNN